MVEPGTVAGLPLCAAHHAELGFAATGHMVAALLELDHGGAIVAALPACVLGQARELQRGFVFRTVGCLGMPFAVAEAAHFGFAAAAFAVPAARTGVPKDAAGSDPLAAAGARAVEPVLRGVFEVFLVPLSLEFVVEVLVDVFQRDVVGCAAAWRHVLGVGQGELEDPCHAWPAPSVGAGEFGCSAARNIVR